MRKPSTGQGASSRSSQAIRLLAAAALVAGGVFCGPARLFAQEAPSAATPSAAPAPAPTRPRGIHADTSHPILPIGSPLPDFSLPGIDGKTHTASDYAHAKLLAIVWESNHCPVSENYETRIHAIYKDYKDKGVQLVAINPNNPKAVLLNELGYTDMTDSFDDMKLRAAYRHIEWPFLYDGETQALATKFGASATPHIFIFDGDRKLRYEGRIDDNQVQSLVRSNDARNALDALLAGREVAVTHTPAFGCSTKWLSKAADVDREMAKIKAAPVALDSASADDLKRLRANDSGKIIVVHFWFAGCKDCASTFHDLETTYRMYRLRDFNFVTVATDKPDQHDEVLKFLQAQYASGTNLQVDTANLKAVQAAVGETWKPGRSFTMVIAPDGKVLYQKQGNFNIYDMRRVILASMPDNKSYVGQHAYWTQGEGQ